MVEFSRRPPRLSNFFERPLWPLHGDGTGRQEQPQEAQVGGDGSGPLDQWGLVVDLVENGFSNLSGSACGPKALAK